MLYVTTCIVRNHLTPQLQVQVQSTSTSTTTAKTTLPLQLPLYVAAWFYNVLHALAAVVQSERSHNRCNRCRRFSSSYKIRKAAFCATSEIRLKCIPFNSFIWILCIKHRDIDKRSLISWTEPCPQRNTRTYQDNQRKFLKIRNVNKKMHLPLISFFSCQNARDFGATRNFTA